MKGIKYLIFGAIIAFVVFQSSASQAGSTNTGKIESLFIIVLVGSVVVGLLVAGLMGMFIYRYREGNTTSPRNKIENEFKWELAWITLALILSAALIIISTPLILDIQNPVNKENAEEINIVGIRFAWRQAFYFDNGTIDKTQTLNGTIHLELKVGQLYKLNITSGDVIHSFFVYELSIKVDAVPGKFNIIYFEIEKAGDYTIACAEFCGSDHYKMFGVIRAT